MTSAFDLLPPRWRADRLLRSEARAWRPIEVLGDDRGVVLVVDRSDRPTVVGRGDPAVVRALVVDLATRRAGQPHGWMSVPRGSDPAPAVLAALGLAPFSSWDWFATAAVPDEGAGGRSVEQLDPVADAEAIRACLTAANPTSSADPGGAHELAWFGVREDGQLLGVIGANAQGGERPQDRSWHLHGLAVRAPARRRGWGAALTVAATRAGLGAGASWVSLGMYADNHDARRIYERLGYRCEARFDSYGPQGADRPPT
ncbi:GNAT family N-acetyltransferase [Cellulomonas composti]|uniref:N-acetyltransferase domain-containing protein n=1 Tax=Cellulomonas composti TaxID=266130 RepID=A0A511J6N0_9CELL|nr:GNAT family N-acetyltransferase [Cellulomonas composti]GEL93651.1 hypothetical protein CCO02nite_03090 [Cellulomonas composti]